MEYFPLTSEFAPLEVPFLAIVTPGIPAPFSSVTVPVSLEAATALRFIEPSVENNGMAKAIMNRMLHRATLCLIG